MNILRNPLAASGIVLMLLGVGNWYTGVTKGAEYTRLLHNHRPEAASGPAEDFPALGTATNTMLLKTLERGRDQLSFIQGKIDFYDVVHSGGRLLVLAGLCLLAAGLYRTRHGERRTPHRAEAPDCAA